MNYDRHNLAEEHEELLMKLNLDQRSAYNEILESSLAEFGKVFFVYGYGGTGKTFVWKTLSAALRSKGHIVLNVASSGIASLLLPGGRTAHSRFSIPFNVNEDSVCNIKQGSHLAEVILKCRLIIWDEAPMMHRHCFEALDRSMRDILKNQGEGRNELPFGGKTVVFGGDFRQILPVIPKGSRQDVVHATINSSYLWSECKVLRLTENMRLQSSGSLSDSVNLKEYANWIARIGDGKENEPNDGNVSVQIPGKFILDCGDDPIAAMVKKVYPDIDRQPLEKSYFEGRAILAPTLEVVDLVNDYMVSHNSKEGRVYLSSDMPCHSDQVHDLMNDIHTSEFLNSISSSGLPKHALWLKVGVPVMLIRNIDPSLGLCNGTRLVITRLGDHVLEGEVLSTRYSGSKVLIPRMSLSPSDPRIPFKFERCQFPIVVSYAMSINKSQGQSLTTVGIILKKPVFSHGQLYVALSRVTNPRGLHIWLPDIRSNNYPGDNYTTNVVFKEVFQNV